MRPARRWRPWRACIRHRQTTEDSKRNLWCPPTGISPSHSSATPLNHDVSEMDFNRGRRLPPCRYCELLPVPLVLRGAVKSAGAKPAFGTGQVADYGRLRGPVYSLKNELSIMAGGPPRPTRAPVRANPPSKTSPFPPRQSRHRCASARPASSPSTNPYTAGPQELWPTPAAPHSAIRPMSASPWPGANTPPCCAANQAPVIRWTADSAAAEARADRPRPAREGAASAPDGRPARPRAPAAAAAARRPPPPPRR